jgi:hypothetical protein
MRKSLSLPDVPFNDFFTFLVMTNVKESTEWELQYQGILITASNGAMRKMTAKCGLQTLWQPGIPHVI